MKLFWHFKGPEMIPFWLFQAPEIRWSLFGVKVHLIILGSILVVVIIAVFDAFLDVIAVFLIVVARHIVLGCGQ